MMTYFVPFRTCLSLNFTEAWRCRNLQITLRPWANVLHLFRIRNDWVEVMYVYQRWTNNMKMLHDLWGDFSVDYQLVKTQLNYFTCGLTVVFRFFCLWKKKTFLRSIESSWAKLNMSMVLIPVTSKVQKEQAIVN